MTAPPRSTAPGAVASLRHQLDRLADDIEEVPLEHLVMVSLAINRIVLLVADILDSTPSRKDPRT